MIIEEFIIGYLNRTLSDVVAYGDVPSPVPDRFVTVEQTGGYDEDKVRFATIAVQSWEMTRAEAAELNEEVIAAMEAMISEDEISKCSLDNSYNFTDLTRKKPRYQAVFSVVY